MRLSAAALMIAVVLGMFGVPGPAEAAPASGVPTSTQRPWTVREVIPPPDPFFDKAVFTTAAAADTIRVLDCKCIKGTNCCGDAPDPGHPLLCGIPNKYGNYPCNCNWQMRCVFEY